MTLVILTTDEKNKNTKMEKAVNTRLGSVPGRQPAHTVCLSEPSSPSPLSALCHR